MRTNRTAFFFIFSRQYYHKLRQERRGQVSTLDKSVRDQDQTPSLFDFFLNFPEFFYIIAGSLLGSRPTAGLMTLDHEIKVRILASQPIQHLTLNGLKPPSLPRTPGNQSRRFPPSKKADGSPLRYGGLRTAFSAVHTFELLLLRSY